MYKLIRRLVGGRPRRQLIIEMSGYQPGAGIGLSTIGRVIGRAERAWMFRRYIQVQIEVENGFTGLVWTAEAPARRLPQLACVRVNDMVNFTYNRGIGHAHIELTAIEIDLVRSPEMRTRWWPNPLPPTQ